MNESNERLKEEISRLKIEFSSKEQSKDEIISNLELKLETSNQTTATLVRAKEEEISSLTTELTTIKNLKDEEISSLKSQIYSLSIRIDCNEMSKKGPGLLSQLNDKQKTPFDRLFVASQSSNDIYNLLRPHTNDKFSTTNSGNFFIEFELEATITISGVTIFSADSCFPKSFDISVEGEKVKSVRGAREFNGKYKDSQLCTNSRQKSSLHTDRTELGRRQ